MVNAMSLFGDEIETHVLWEKRADAAVHVLSGAALPGGVGMGKEEMGIEFPSEPFVLSELLIIAGGQRMNAGRERRQQGNRSIGDSLGGLERSACDQGLAGFAFIERHERLNLAGADDQAARMLPHLAQPSG